LPLPRSKLFKLKRGREEYFAAARTPEKEKCIHINLDDDDSLAPWYVDFIVNASKDLKEETLITFVDGAVVNWEDETNEKPLTKFSLASRMFYPLNNHGLSILTERGFGTHELSNHTKIPVNFPHLKVIEVSNEGKIGWIRTESKNSHHKTYHPMTLLKRPFLKVKTCQEAYALV
jgi:hypothetical protein